MSNSDFLLENKLRSITLANLMENSQYTLQHLKLSFGSRWPQLPSIGVHNFDIFTKIRIEANDDHATLAFPQLLSFSLTTLIISTPYLMKLITAQPKLNSHSFEHVDLGDPGSKWSGIASTLPPSLEIWEVKTVGHDPFPNNSNPVSSNWTRPWNPDAEPLSVEMDWRMIEQDSEALELAEQEVQKNRIV
jgi:hypothetical protein